MWIDVAPGGLVNTDLVSSIVIRRESDDCFLPYEIRLCSGNSWSAFNRYKTFSDAEKALEELKSLLNAKQE